MNINTNRAIDILIFQYDDYTGIQFIFRLIILRMRFIFYYYGE